MPGERLSLKFLCIFHPFYSLPPQLRVSLALKGSVRLDGEAPPHAQMSTRKWNMNGLFWSMGGRLLDIIALCFGCVLEVAHGTQEQRQLGVLSGFISCYIKLRFPRVEGESPST